MGKKIQPNPMWTTYYQFNPRWNCSTHLTFNHKVMISITHNRAILFPVEETLKSELENDTKLNEAYF